jgi:hypothetical protein
MFFRYGPTKSDTPSRRVAIAPPTLTRKGTSVYDRIRASSSLLIITIAAATILAPESSQAIDTVVPSLMPGLAAFRYGAPQTKIREQCKCECTDVEGPAVNADFAGDGVTVISASGYAVALGEVCPVDFVFRGEGLIGVCVYRDEITFEQLKALNEEFMETYATDLKSDDVFSEVADLQAFMRGDPHSVIRYGSENRFLTVSMRWEQELRRSTATFVFRSPNEAVRSTIQLMEDKARDVLVRKRAGFITQ